MIKPKQLLAKLRRGFLLIAEGMRSITLYPSDVTDYELLDMDYYPLTFDYPTYFDYGSISDYYRLSTRSRLSPEQALAEDWRRVGEDMRKSIDNFKASYDATQHIAEIKKDD